MNCQIKFRLYFIFLIFLSSCNEQTHENTKQLVSTNQAMFNEVASIYQKIDPTKIDYLFNKRRSAGMKRQLTQMQYPQKLNLQLLYAKELMRCNKIEESIKVTKEIDKALIDYKINLPNNIKEKYLTLKAIINIRKGELDNCINAHHSTSCILPFSEYAVHKKKEGSQKAVEYLKTVLQINPENYQAIWLLNICHQTLGTPPHKIDSKYNLNIPKINSEQPWKNKAQELKVNFDGLAGGAIADDFNNDGLIDIICSSWGEGDGLKYYENTTTGKFKDKSKSSNLNKVFGGLNINQCDFNNDGFLDIFVMRGGWFEDQGKIPNSLLKNNGDGTFTDVTKQAGLYTLAPTQTSTWCDFNLDGNLDLFVANESSSRAQFKNELWINNGDETFTNKINGSGLEQTGFYKACSQVELEFENHKPALFLSNYRGSNKLYAYTVKTGGNDLEFVDISEQYGIHDPITSFSSFAFDYNNSGSENIFVSGYGDTRGELNPTLVAGANYSGKNIGSTPKLYSDFDLGEKNEITFDKGIYTMGCNFGDLDNDGFQDIYLATGDPAMGSIVPNMIYKNIKGREFKDISFETGMAHLQKGHGVAFADFDGDGDQDIYNVLGGAYEGDSFQNAYFENPGNNNNWITLKLMGIQSNKAAIGAKVKLTIEDSNGSTNTLYRKVTSGSSFGANSLQLEVGLGNATNLKECEIIWPFPKSIDIYKNLEINKSHILTEGQ